MRRITRLLLSVCASGLIATSACRAAELADAGGGSAPAGTTTNPPAPTGPTAPTGPGATAATTPPTAPAANTLSIEDAVEGLTDEDEPTRHRAFDRLSAATHDDIPALKKYADSKDPEIRRQVDLVLQRLNRGELAFVLKFADGTPAAGVKVEVKVSQIIEPDADGTDGADKSATGAQPAGVAGGQVQIQVNGGAVAVNGIRVNGPIVMINGRMVRGQPGAEVKQVFDGELTADKDGKVSVGRFNDGKYDYVLSTEDPLPTMNLNGEVTLSKDAAPGDLKVVHGVTATVTVVDDAGQPVADATVADIGANPYMRQMIDRVPAKMLGQSLRNATENSTDAKGVATLEKLGTHPIDLVAFKDGYETVEQNDVAFTDGKPLAVSLKLVKIHPKDVTLKLNGAGDESLTGARALLVDQMGYFNVTKAAISMLDPKAADTYVKNGATDLGTVGDDGSISTKIMPDNYYVLVFPKDGSKVLVANLAAMRIQQTAWSLQLMDYQAQRQRFRVMRGGMMVPQVAVPANAAPAKAVLTGTPAQANDASKKPEAADASKTSAGAVNHAAATSSAPAPATSAVTVTTNSATGVTTVTSTATATATATSTAAPAAPPAPVLTNGTTPNPPAGTDPTQPAGK